MKPMIRFLLSSSNKLYKEKYTNLESLFCHLPVCTCRYLRWWGVLGTIQVWYSWPRVVGSAGNRSLLHFSLSTLRSFPCKSSSKWNILWQYTGQSEEPPQESAGIKKGANYLWFRYWTARQHQSSPQVLVRISMKIRFARHTPAFLPNTHEFLHTCRSFWWLHRCCS